MNKRKSILTVALLAASLAAQAQITTATLTLPTNAPPANTGTFATSVQSYFSSLNGDLAGTWTNTAGHFFTSVDSIQGGKYPLANTIGGDYAIWRKVSVDALFRNTGTSGTILSAQGGIGLRLNLVDVAINPYIDAGYGFNESGHFYVEPGVRILKALTPHTFAGVGIAGQFPQNRQVFSAFVGFTF